MTNQAIRPSCLSTRVNQRRAHKAAACNAPPWSTAVCLAGKFFVVPIFFFVCLWCRHHWTHHCRDTAVSWRAVGTSSPVVLLLIRRACGTRPCGFLDPAPQSPCLLSNQPQRSVLASPFHGLRCVGVHSLPVVDGWHWLPGVQGRMSIARCESRPRVGYGSRGTKMWGVGGGGVGKGGWRGWVGGGDTERKQGFHETPPPPPYTRHWRVERGWRGGKDEGWGEGCDWDDTGRVCVTPGMTPG